MQSQERRFFNNGGSSSKCRVRTEKVLKYFLKKISRKGNHHLKKEAGYPNAKSEKDQFEEENIARIANAVQCHS